MYSRHFILSLDVICFFSLSFFLFYRFFMFFDMFLIIYFFCFVFFSAGNFFICCCFFLCFLISYLILSFLRFSLLFRIIIFPVSTSFASHSFIQTLSLPAILPPLYISVYIPVYYYSNYFPLFLSLPYLVSFFFSCDFLLS